MERLEYDSYGGPEVVRMGVYELPAPQENELLVRVSAASINPMDWKIRSGDMKMMTGTKFPRGMGTDFSGTVEAVGPKVTSFKSGDPVVGTTSMKRSGAFAPRLITTQDLVVKKPGNLSFSDAAALPIAGVTAWQAIVKFAALKRGQKIFVNGASGSVGQAAVAIANDIGATVVGRVGPMSVGQAATLGLATAVDYTKPLPPALRGIFDLVFDVNGSLSPSEQDWLAKRGGKIVDITPTREKFLRALVSRSRKFLFADVKAPNLQQVVDLAAAQRLAIPIARTISLADAPATLATLENGHRLNGKAVIVF